MENNGDLDGRVHCPHCDSPDLRINESGLPSICVVCFNVIKRRDVTKQNIWPGMAISVGVRIAIVAGIVMGSAAGYETYLARKPAHADINYQGSCFNADSGLVDRAEAVYGNKHWYKGFIDRPDSCELMPSKITPAEDVRSDGRNGHVADAQTCGNEYALFYTDGFRSWIYASSENECRRAVSAWLWHHTIDART